MAGETVFTVTRLNEYASSILKNDPRLRSIRVSGEISGFKRHSSGHLYFNLKDENAVIACVMFRSSAEKLGFVPREGMSVVVRGSVSIYAKDGKYQLYAEGMRINGEGELYRQFLLLKARLEAEGVFENSRPIPALPRMIGVATSETGAALRDIVTVTRRRFPRMNILLAPCLVQGEGAPKSIASAIAALQRFRECGVIIVGRGGGSYEDLSCFNDEGVARAIFASRVPVVSAVGHETDFTIADFAADLRAPTPSAAAEICCPVYDELRTDLEYYRESVVGAARDALDGSRVSLSALTSSAAMASPVHALRLVRERLGTLVSSADSTAKTSLLSARDKLSSGTEKLIALSPGSVLGRGYSIITDSAGAVVTDITGLKPNDPVSIRMKSGSAAAIIETVTPTESASASEKGI